MNNCNELTFLLNQNEISQAEGKIFRKLIRIISLKFTETSVLIPYKHFLKKIPF